MIQMIFGSPVVFLKADNVKELFSEKTYQETIEQLMHPDNKFIDHPFTRGGKSCTTDLDAEMGIGKIQGLKILYEFLKNIALNYVHLYTDKSVKDLKFCTSWVNLTFQGCEIKNHNDNYYNAEKSLIVTFYPRVPENGSKLVFIHNSKHGEWASDCLEENLIRTVIEEGDIVIFDNFISHAVDAHGSTIPRMCIATEFTIVT